MSSINMSSSARYVTQAGFYDQLGVIKGPLTNRAIERYRKMGYYGSGIVALARAAKKKARAKLQTDSEKKRERINNLLKAYV